MGLPRRTVNRWRDLDVAEAVALRDWAFVALSSPPGSDAMPTPPAVAPATWELFLEAEACAIALSRRLKACPPGLSPEALRVLEAAARSEARRVLAARAQLRALGDLAARHGIEVVALKGAVCVGAGRDLALEDIDLLARPEDADRFAAVLDEAGYRPTGGGSPHHLVTRSLPGGLGVEIHVSLRPGAAIVHLSLWATAVPLSGAPGLRRLAPLEHAWHVLMHAALDHPDRRGRIRDLLLIAEAVEDCSQSEIHELQKRVELHRDRSELTSVMHMACAIRGPAPSDDEFRRFSALRYNLLALLDRLPVPEPLLEKTWLWAIAFLGSRGDRKRLLAETMERNLAPSKYGMISIVERRLPRSGRAWMLVWRWLRVLVVLPVAVILAGLARLHVRRLGV